MEKSPFERKIEANIQDRQNLLQRLGLSSSITNLIYSTEEEESVTSTARTASTEAKNDGVAQDAPCIDSKDNDKRPDRKYNSTVQLGSNFQIWSPAVILNEGDNGGVNIQILRAEEVKQHMEIDENYDIFQCSAGQLNKRPTRSCRMPYEPDAEFLDLTYCECCKQHRKGLCYKHPFMLVLNNTVSDEDDCFIARARLTAPWPIQVKPSRAAIGELGAWTKSCIDNCSLMFGPYEGMMLSSKMPIPKYSWRLNDRVSEGGEEVVDASDELLSNWTRYVRCTSKEHEANLTAIKLNGNIYYKVKNKININSELLLYTRQKLVRECFGWITEGENDDTSSHDSRGKDNCSDSDQSDFDSSTFNDPDIRNESQDGEDLNKKNVRKSTSSLDIPIPEQMCKCKKCKTAFYKMDFKQFQNKPHNLKIINCSYSNCSFFALSEKCLNQHGKKTHTIKSLYKCEYCMASYVNQYFLKEHLNIHKSRQPYQCQKCKKTFTHQTTCTKHVAICSKHCNACGYKYLSEDDKIAHNLLICCKLLLRCDVCITFRCSSKSLLLDHIQSHSVVFQDFTCSWCDYSSDDNDDIIKHMKCHTNNSMYKCKYCEYTDYCIPLCEHQIGHENDH